MIKMKEKIKRFLFKKIFNKDQRMMINDVFGHEYFAGRKRNRFTPNGIVILHEIERIIKETPVRK